LLKRPVGRPPHEVRRYFASFTYLAQNWNKSRHVVAKVEWHPGCTRASASSSPICRALPRAIVAFYNQRGTAEQWMKEGKNAIKWTRLSCRTFAANAVRLQLHALAYNLGNFMRTLAMPKTAEPWSLTSLREKLITWRQGHQPRALRHLPNGRGRGATTDVRRHLVADRSVAGAARAGMTGARPSKTGNEGRGMPRCRQNGAFSAFSPVNPRLRSLLLAATAICRWPSWSKR